MLNRHRVLAGLVALAGVALGQQRPPTVELDYGTFQGAYLSSHNLSYWQKIPFAAPPIGENRFRAPQPPIRITTGLVYDSSQRFNACPQKDVRPISI
jgi:carboxylesterase type B